MLLVTTLESRGTLTELQLSSDLQHLKASQASSTADFFTEQLWNKTEDLPIHERESCSSKVLQMGNTTQKRNRNKAKAVEKMKQDSEDTRNVTVNLVKQVHTQINPCSKQH